MSDNFFGTIGNEDTVYHSKGGFDDSFKIDINFTKMVFEETLNVSETPSNFRVNYCGNPWVLKVFHNNGDLGYAHDGIRDLDHSHYEIRAYCRLKHFMLAIDLTNCTPHLDTFQRDTGPPSAILIEEWSLTFRED
ncbi:conserved hypothetical protein [Histoplasma capsulatum H143]|uniref:Uncharacterized protein n=1 Tax=Ajellomyces capsulatus (strain H143) TaxID=544712 RepID=C6HJS5_AJECH|nr:conserved hypothetical protein [Histoplasma capsulatum H143]